MGTRPKGKSTKAPYEVGQLVGPIIKHERDAPRGLANSSQLYAEIGRLGYQTPFYAQYSSNGRACYTEMQFKSAEGFVRIYRQLI